MGLNCPKTHPLFQSYQYLFSYLTSSYSEISKIIFFFLDSLNSKHRFFLVCQIIWYSSNQFGCLPISSGFRPYSKVEDPRNHCQGFVEIDSPIQGRFRSTNTIKKKRKKMFIDRCCCCPGVGGKVIQVKRLCRNFGRRGGLIWQFPPVYLCWYTSRRRARTYLFQSFYIWYTANTLYQHCLFRRRYNSLLGVRKYRSDNWLPTRVPESTNKMA